MKKTFLFFNALLAIACCLLASCKKTNENNVEEPVFPEAFTDFAVAGEEYVFSIEPNMEWTLSIPEDSAPYFWIQDGSQTAYKIRGNAGEQEIRIGVYDIQDFEDHTVEISLTMKDVTKVIGTLTLPSKERLFSVYPVIISDDDFSISTEGSDQRYQYQTEALEQKASVELFWPVRTTGFISYILVESNFNWSLNEKPEWLEVEEITSSGTKKELLLSCDPSNYELEGTSGNIVFTAENTESVSFEYSVILPPCKNILNFSRIFPGATLKFNAAGEYTDDFSGSLMENASGNVTAAEGLKFYVFNNNGGSYDGTADNTAWVQISYEWNKDSKDVIQTNGYTISVEENTGDARKATVVVLPKPLAETVDNPENILNGDKTGFKDEFKDYVFVTIEQEKAAAVQPGEEAIFAPEGEYWSQVGAEFRKLTEADGEIFGYVYPFMVPYNYMMTFTDASVCEYCGIQFNRKFTGYKIYGPDGNYGEPVAEDDETFWLTFNNVPGNDIYYVLIDTEKFVPGYYTEAFIEFYDEQGSFAVIYVKYDKNAIIGGGGSEINPQFYYGEMASLYDGSTIQELTDGDLYNKYNPGNGAPVFQLTYIKEYASMSMLSGLPTGNCMVAPIDEEWLNIEFAGEYYIITMNAEKAFEDLSGDKIRSGAITFYDSNWSPVMVLVCTLDLRNAQ